MLGERSTLKVLLLYLLFFFALLLLATPASGWVSFRFSLDGYQLVPAVGGDDFGKCVGLTDELNTTFWVNCVHNLPDALTAGLYRGAAGTNGTLVYPFSTATPASGLIDVTPDILADLLLEQFYVVVTTADHPAGRLRGQVRFERVNDAEQLLFPLTGDQVSPPASTGASGRCGASYKPGENAFVLVCSHTVEHPDYAVIQRGAPGQNGDVVLQLGTGNNPIMLLTEITDPTFFTDLASGNLYLQIYTDSAPEGALRGQLGGCWNSIHRLCLHQERFAVELEATLQNGTVISASAVPEGADAGMFFFLRPDNREMLVKVLDGCALNDHYWVFFSATTNVGLELTVTDTRSGQVRTYANAVTHAADPVLDTAAFATCP